ncbi:MAG: hypothetical protein M1815_001206 [Lichina confinis]|nr:MAG: hypothetical protein M1815_001206 [Lichina confinis]
MGQHMSTQREHLLGQDDRRLSQPTAGRRSSDLDCLDDRHLTALASDVDADRDARRPQRSNRRRGLMRRSVALDAQEHRLHRGPEDTPQPAPTPTPTQGDRPAGEPLDRPSTPFDSGDIVLDSSPPASQAATSTVASGFSNMIRRGSRMMHPRAGAVRDVDDDMLPDLTSQTRRPLSSRLSTMLGPSQTSRGGARNRLSTMLSGPGPSPGFLRRRRNVAPASQPSPATEPDGWAAWDDRSSLGIDLLEGSPLDASLGLGSAGGSTPRRSRLSRVRESLLPPVPPFLQHLSNRHGHQLDSHVHVPVAPSSRLTVSGPGNLLPQIPTSNVGLDLTRASLSPLAQPGVDADPLDRGPRRSAVERQSRRATNGGQTGVGRAPPTTEDQAARLSRHLSVAATAIAASLVGNTERAFAEAHDVASDGVDGSFDSFLRALQNGSLASALRNGGNSPGDDGTTNPTDATFSPINFFRIFRFGSTGDDDDGNNNNNNNSNSNSNSSNNNSGSSNSNTTSNRTDASTTPASQTGSTSPDTNTENGNRMVPVIIVGIRSVTPRQNVNQDDGNIHSPLFDALSNLPLIMPAGLPSRSSGTFLRRTDRRSRFGRSRRASMSAVSSFPANYDSQRHQRLNSGIGRPQFDARPSASTAMPSVLSESPPGPHPPPSTPAEHALSVGSSGNNTPTRRPSSASAGVVSASAGSAATAARPANVNPLEHSIDEAITSAGLGGVRRRRLSDGEFARYRDFGPGSSRRNGIVGDSEVDPASASASASFTGGPQPEGTRTWIVYVLGGSYPEDHPILTTPSLFTDSPTYEDMLLLSSILGPAKPPVASREDVASAPGVYRISTLGDSWVATTNGFDAGGEHPQQLLIEAGERCLICLCEYEVEEEVRQLSRCRHVYHRECIDEVSGNGLGVGSLQKRGEQYLLITPIPC